MNMTELTRNYIIACGFDPETLSKDEVYGMATVLFACIVDCAKRGSDTLAIDDACYGGAQKTDLACQVWRWLAEATDKDCALLMTNHFTTERGEPTNLVYKGYEYLASEQVADLPFLNKEKAVSRNAYYTSQVPTS